VHTGYDRALVDHIHTILIIGGLLEKPFLIQVRSADLLQILLLRTRANAGRD
jgi:hypothetical protein